MSNIEVTTEGQIETPDELFEEKANAIFIEYTLLKARLRSALDESLGRYVVEETRSKLKQLHADVCLPKRPREHRRNLTTEEDEILQATRARKRVRTCEQLAARNLQLAAARQTNKYSEQAQATVLKRADSRNFKKSLALAKMQDSL